MLPVYLFAALTAVFGLAGAVLLLRPQASLVPPDRLQQLTRARLELTDTSGPGLRQRLASIGARLRSRFSRKDDSLLQLRLQRAGIDTDHAADLYLASRFLGPLVAFFIACFLPGTLSITGTLLPAAAFLVPDLLLRRRIRKRQKAISNGVGDMLDLLVICVEAGLGLDQAVLRVAEELALSHPELHDELLHINREQRAGKPRADAWADAVTRMDVPEMAAFTNMSLQAERFGTPIARALGDYSNNVRLTRIQLAEEKAAKTTIKIIFPLALFIFPSIFIVLLGPAVLAIMRGF